MYVLVEASSNDKVAVDAEMDQQTIYNDSTAISIQVDQFSDSTSDIQQLKVGVTIPTIY